MQCSDRERGHPRTSTAHNSRPPSPSSGCARDIDGARCSGNECSVRRRHQSDTLGQHAQPTPASCVAGSGDAPARGPGALACREEGSATDSWNLNRSPPSDDLQAGGTTASRTHALLLEFDGARRDRLDRLRLHVHGGPQRRLSRHTSPSSSRRAAVVRAAAARTVSE